MTIVFVIDCYGVLTNGTTMTAYRFVEGLKARGHTVRIVSTGVKGENMFAVPEWKIPIASEIASHQSVHFAKPVDSVLREAFSGADVVHFFMPFALAKRGVKIARQMGIPYTAAFHVQPENITYGMGLCKAGAPLAAFIYWFFRVTFYKYVDNIHCPSAFIADELRAHHYRSRFHVISNGVADEFRPLPEGNALHSNSSGQGGTDPFRILMVGRYAPEKRQDVLLRAVKLSKYASRIQLTLAGAGPREKRLRRLAADLGLSDRVSFGFHSQDELIQIIRSADLYVHAADVEIEAIACLEAFACGKVPVIADSPKSATKQFALDERSLFKPGSPKDLAAKIDYWIEHPEEKAQMEKAYAARGEVFRLDKSIRKAEGMFLEAVADKRCREIEKTPEGRAYARRFNKGLPKRLFSIVLYYFIVIPLQWFYCTFVLHLHIKNRKAVHRAHLRGGAVTVSNHVHTIDSVMVALAVWPLKPIYTSIPANFAMPFAGFFVDTLGSVPVPVSLMESKIFFYELSRQLRNGRIVHIFPEGELIRYDTHLRPFKRGAFDLAVDANVPIVPVRFVIKRRPATVMGFFFGGRVDLIMGDPLKPDPNISRKSASEELEARCFAKMKELGGEK